ncbi:hypothetical protein HBH70_159820 [Parastagonospora nodorum]|nr:hypothetical protein HBH53_154110 [Parastagonospora nodorum]KAH4014447.1 hypothetical protein HBI09_210600 [Parastagonospora nodorum]KAH4046932.1 hypothetical protein HBH49_175070 [Parastagonospora nodorum]KAH4063073.1 hypothetical protein HBH50_199220 [Parastagonospora nodorum]KAH4083508.1 hypothetical protein HBH48_176120 [Parastagonospora nodorum]
MEDLEDELDLRYHRGLQPDVYYRCPTLESLNAALYTEVEKNASALIPVETVTEFIFGAASTITIPVGQQPSLNELIEPAEYLQSITVDYALCRDIDGKDRLKVQRAIARSIIEAVQDADGFKYAEKSAQSKDGGDGARFKYVCRDSVQFKNKRSHKKKKEKPENSDDCEAQPKKEGDPQLQGYGCGGAIHIKFSIKREAINVVYKHNPIHSSPPAEESSLPALALETTSTPQAMNNQSMNGNKEQKKKRKKKDQEDVENDYRDPDLDMSTSPEAPRAATKNKRKKDASAASAELSAKKDKKSKEALSPSASRKKTQILEPSPPPMPVRGKACIRCREKKIKCNEGKPTCNQCKRGLWTCQYEVTGAKKRSKNGCINCKARKRKCTEERPSCAHCLRLDDDCEYVDYS